MKCLLSLVFAFAFGGLLAAEDQAKPGYLGVMTVPVPEAVRSQLEIPEGTGLLVEAVMPESPAAREGVQRNDVLCKIDDQVIGDMAKLQSVIRSKGAGQAVTLTLMRKGREMSVPVVLGEFPEFDCGSLEGKVLEFGWSELEPDPGILPEELEAQLKNLRGNLSQLLQAQEMMVMFDGTHHLVLEVKEGKKKLTVSSVKDNSKLWEGPVTTQEEKDAIPEEFREKFKILDQGSSFEIKIEEFLADLDEGTQLKYSITTPEALKRLRLQLGGECQEFESLLRELEDAEQKEEKKVEKKLNDSGSDSR